MSRRTQPTEEQLQEIRNLRGQMSAKNIQKKYGIGAPRLYRLWKESAPPTVQKDTHTVRTEKSLNGYIF